MIKRISFQQGLYLFKHAELNELQSMASERLKQLNRSRCITFVLDTNPNYTNVCEADCTFCSFYRKKGHRDSYTKSVEQVMQSFERAKQAGLSTVLLQGGLHPDLPLEYYVDLVRTAKSLYPDINCHFFSAPEIFNISQVNQLSYNQVLQALFDAGQRSLPGGGAEILSEKVRKRLSPKKMAPNAWIDIHKVAHQIGFKSTATMMYGHIEEAEDILTHFETLRQCQDETCGFTAFIPWSYKRMGNALGKIIKDWAGHEAYFRLLAFSRIYLDNFDHIQASWFSEGKEIGMQSLNYGADDFGGLIMEEEVHRATDFVNKSTVEEIIAMIHRAGFDAAERDTFYNIIHSWPLNEKKPLDLLLSMQNSEPSKLEVLKQASSSALSRWSRF